MNEKDTEREPGPKRNSGSVSVNHTIGPSFESSFEQMNCKNKLEQKRCVIIREICTLTIFDGTTRNTIKILGVIVALWSCISRVLRAIPWNVYRYEEWYPGLASRYLGRGEVVGMVMQQDWPWLDECWSWVTNVRNFFNYLVCMCRCLKYSMI